MLKQRQNQFVLPMILLAITVVIFSFLIIWIVFNQVSTLSLNQTTSTVQNVPVVAVVNTGEMAQSLMFDYQSAGLADHWVTYQDSLNYADYASVYEINRNIAHLLMFNNRIVGLADNWADYQASLNYADYTSVYEINRDIAHLLMFNNRTVGLANNWADYQDSLNYADYASVYEINRDIAHLLMFNNQAVGLADHWTNYQDSLNYADYTNGILPIMPTHIDQLEEPF